MLFISFGCKKKRKKKKVNLIGTSSVCRSSASYYEVLGVKPDASLEEIKNAFFDKSKKVLLHNISISQTFGRQNNLQNIQTADITVIQKDFEYIICKDSGSEKLELSAGLRKCSNGIVNN